MDRNIRPTSLPIPQPIDSIKSISVEIYREQVNLLLELCVFSFLGGSPVSLGNHFGFMLPRLPGAELVCMVVRPHTSEEV